MKIVKILAALLLLLPLSHSAWADLCIDPTTGGWATCSASATGPLGAPGAIGNGTPSSGAFTTLSATGQITSTLATGTAPFSIASTTNVANLNASSLSGATFAAPGAVGGGTPSTGAFTTLSATGAITSTLATGTAPFSVASTTNVANLNASTLSGATFANPGAIGGGTPSTGAFTALSATSFAFAAGISVSGASWTTTSPVFNAAALTLNDTTASGTVTTEAAYSLQAPNFTSTGGASTTVTNATSLWLAAPTCSGGLVCTNFFSLFAAGKINGAAGLNITGGVINLNASSNATVNIGTGTTSSTVSIGNGANLVNLGPTELNAGTKFTTGNFSGCSVTNGTPGTTVGGPQAGKFVANSHGTTCSVTITINGATGKTAANGWVCFGSDTTTGVALSQSGTSTTTCTLLGTVNADADTVAFMAMGY